MANQIYIDVTVVHVWLDAEGLAWSFMIVGGTPMLMGGL